MRQRFAHRAAALVSVVLLSSCGGSGTTPSTLATTTTSRIQRNAPFSYTVHPRVRAFLGDLNLSNCTVTTQCVTPTTVKTGYNFPSNQTGAGKTIMIVEAFGSPTVVADANRFFQDTGLPPMNAPSNSGACASPCLTIYTPGGKPTFNPGQAGDVSWAEETSLDVQWAHAAAPGANIALIVAANDQGQTIQSAQQYAVQSVHGDVLSLSFGVQELSINGGANNTQLQQAESVYQQAAAQHITVVASAGDLGALGGFGTPNAQYPASDPRVLAVGGTNLRLFHNARYRSESVWNDANDCVSPCSLGADGATGGSPSTLFAAPAWQLPALRAYNAISGTPLALPLMRANADVSYNASPNTGVEIYIGFGSRVPSLGKNGYYAVGGTSQGSPQWAGIIATADALRGTDLGCINAALYGIPAATKATVLHDVTSGNNQFPASGAGYAAAPGWDPPTGWGSPIASTLVTLLASLAPTPC